MTDQPIDPAATPDDDNAPDIAADDVGASGMAEEAQNEADDEDGVDGEGVEAVGEEGVEVGLEVVFEALDELGGLTFHSGASFQAPDKRKAACARGGGCRCWGESSPAYKV